MRVRLDTVPVYSGTLATIARSDPWSGGTRQSFCIDVCRMMPAPEGDWHWSPPADEVPRTPSTLRGSETLMLRWRGEARYRILPLALAQLVLEARVSPHEVPTLLHERESQLRKRDYRPAAGSLLLRRLAVGFIVTALLAAAATYRLGGTEARAPRLVVCAGLGLLGCWCGALATLMRARVRRIRRLFVASKALDAGL
jgi:hypothetical protein